MNIHDVVQGSHEWDALRASCFTASEAPAMAGVSKYQSRSDLLKTKYTGEVPEVTPAQQRIFDRGHAAEASARPIAERIIGEELYPCTATHDDHEWMLASFDGCTMMETVIWEHKLINDELRTATAETLAEHYKVQMDQQLAVSGAEKCLFMASDGTEDDCNYFWYTTTPERIAALFAGWAQFKADLEAYQPQAQTVAPQGEAPDKLPTLSIQMTGGVQASNLPDFKAKALAMIDGIKTELVTDKDFADADSTVKWLQKGEKQLEESKQRALEQTATIAELFDTIDELRETMRQKRLHLDKLVKAEKNNRRVEIERKAKEAFSDWLACLNQVVPVTTSLDVANAMKGKKTLATLQAAADDEVARAKVEAQQEAQRLADNKALIEKHQGDYAFLFNDWRDLIQRDAEFIKLQVENRIAHHKQEEQKRLDAERERIRQEEAAKAQREAAEAEAKRQAEEAEKRKQEPQPEPEPLPAAAEHKPLDTSRLSAAADSYSKQPATASKPETVTLSRGEYEQLLADQAKLRALEAMGVDNWSGYEQAMQQLAA
ncbi:YqaJ viral recombinase family protein [Halomonas sp. KM072]